MPTSAYPLPCAVMASFYPIRSRDVYRYGLLIVLLVVLAVFLLWPITLTVQGGFFGPVPVRNEAGQITRYVDGFTFRYVQQIFENPVYLEGLSNSLSIATCTTLLALLLAMPLALLSARHTFPGKAIMTSIVLVPLILPPFVGAIGMRALLGRFGAINALLTDVGMIGTGQPGIDFLGGAMFGASGAWW